MMEDLHSPPLPSAAAARVTITFNSFVVPSTANGEINFDIVWTTSAIRSAHFLLMAGLWLNVLLLLLVTTLQYQKSWYSKGRPTVMLMIMTMFPNHLMASCLGLWANLFLWKTLCERTVILCTRWSSFTMTRAEHEPPRTFPTPTKHTQKNQLNAFARWVLCNMQSEPGQEQEDLRK